MLILRKGFRPIIGYGRYSTNGVSVYRGTVKQRLFADGFHLIADGALSSFDVVSVKLALAAGVKVEVKPKATRKRKSKKNVD